MEQKLSEVELPLMDSRQNRCMGSPSIVLLAVESEMRLIVVVYKSQVCITSMTSSAVEMGTSSKHRSNAYQSVFQSSNSGGKLYERMMGSTDARRSSEFEETDKASSRTYYSRCNSANRPKLPNNAYFSCGKSFYNDNYQQPD
jgi:hypothetical protein